MCGGIHVRLQKHTEIEGKSKSRRPNERRKLKRNKSTDSNARNVMVEYDERLIEYMQFNEVGYLQSETTAEMMGKTDA